MAQESKQAALEARYETVRVAASSSLLGGDAEEATSASSLELYDLERTPRSGPYWLRPERLLRFSRFNCIRGVMYAVAFVAGLLRWLVELFRVCLGFRATYEVISDDDLARLFTQRVPFSSLVKAVPCIVPLAPPPDDARLSLAETTTSTSVLYDLQQTHLDIGQQQHRAYLKLSTEDMQLMHSFSGTYIEPVVVWFGCDDPRADRVHWKLEAIDVRSTRMTPEVDGLHDRWALAKLYAMQAMHYMLILEFHPFIHFRQDAFDQATKQMFPDADHELRQLLDPHAEFTAEINHNALESDRSPLNARATAGCCYDAHTVPREGIDRLVERGHQLRVASVAYDMERGPDIHLRPHYEAIRKLCTAVVEQLLTRIHSIPEASRRDEEFFRLFRWIHLLKHNLHYPDESFQLATVNPTPLILLLTDHIFTVSVQHSVEHDFFSHTDQRLHPFSIWKPWSPDAQLPDATSCCAWRCGCGPDSSAAVVPLWERLKQIMYTSLFFEWWNNRLYGDGRLQTTQYAFTDPRLREAAAAFRTTLASLSPAYVHPDRISRSIQW